jgi:hypothetical protein
MEFTAPITDVHQGDKVSGICGHRILVTRPVEPVDDGYVDVWLKGMPYARRVSTAQRVLILRNEPKPPYLEGDPVRVLVYDNGTVLAPATVAECTLRGDGHGWNLTVNVTVGGDPVQRSYHQVNNKGGHDYVLRGHRSA